MKRSRRTQIRKTFENLLTSKIIINFVSTTFDCFVRCLDQNATQLFNRTVVQFNLFARQNLLSILISLNDFKDLFPCVTYHFEKREITKRFKAEAGPQI